MGNPHGNFDSNLRGNLPPAANLAHQLALLEFRESVMATYKDSLPSLGKNWHEGPDQKNDPNLSPKVLIGTNREATRTTRQLTDHTIRTWHSVTALTYLLPESRTDDRRNTGIMICGSTLHHPRQYNTVLHMPTMAS